MWLILSQRVMELISSALNNPLSLGEDNKEQKVCHCRVNLRHMLVM